MGLPTGHKSKKMSSSKCTYTACKVPKLSQELLLQENNEVDCEAEHSNVNAIFHIDQNTVLQENSFDCEDGKDNNKETIVISIHHSLTEGYTLQIHS